MSMNKCGNNRLPSARYSPYTSRTNDKEKKKEEQKEEAIQLGVEFSLLVAEAMFVLSDDIRSVLLFCFWLLKYAGKTDYNGPAVGRVFLVMEYVFNTYIKPKNGVYKDGGKSHQWELIQTLRPNFCFGIGGLAHIVGILKIDHVVKPSGFEHYNRERKILEEKLQAVKDVSEANGFGREAIESNILHMWKPLFETSTTSVMINPHTRVIELFRPVMDEANRDSSSLGLTSLIILMN